jgi:transcriptional regulator with XRE-family HTH domain
MSNPTSHPLSRRIIEEADLLKDALLGALRTRRKQLGISQRDLADRIAVRRSTVLKGEVHRGNISLSYLVRWVRALNLTATLNATNDELPDGLVHRSLLVYRGRYDLREEQRECALAESWEYANQQHSMGLGAILPTLVPDITPSQARVAATVVQWLGSDVGFDFLRRTLAIAGYAIVDVKRETTAIDFNASGRNGR